MAPVLDDTLKGTAIMQLTLQRQKYLAQGAVGDKNIVGTHRRRPEPGS